jgi:hypothetical protein
MHGKRRGQERCVWAGFVNWQQEEPLRSRWRTAVFIGWHEPDESPGSSPDLSGSGCNTPGRLGVLSNRDPYSDTRAHGPPYPSFASSPWAALGMGLLGFERSHVD